MLLEGECWFLLWLDSHIRLGSSLMLIEAGTEEVQGVGMINILIDLHGVALVVCQGFDTSPHAARVVVMKVILYLLPVSALGVPDALRQALLRSSVGQLIP